MDKNVVEIWRPVKDWDGLYSVSNNGGVKSHDRYIDHYKGGRRLIPGRILKQVNRKGYLYVNLAKDGISIARPVHQLVAEVFVSGHRSGYIVNHEDCNPLNNNYTNLKWGTCAYNTQHAVDNGLIKKYFGTDNHQSKINKSKADKIRSLVKNGMKYSEIGEKFGVSAATVCNINKNKCWI